LSQVLADNPAVADRVEAGGTLVGRGSGQGRNGGRGRECNGGMRHGILSARRAISRPARRAFFLGRSDLRGVGLPGGLDSPFLNPAQQMAAGVADRSADLDIGEPVTSRTAPDR
jgi:hypothetical protein